MVSKRTRSDCLYAPSCVTTRTSQASISATTHCSLPAAGSISTTDHGNDTASTHQLRYIIETNQRCTCSLNLRRTICIPGLDAHRYERAPALKHVLPFASMLPRVLLQILVDESDRHAALTDRGGNAFHRAQPHIATGENSGSTRFEQVGIAVVRPAPSLHHVVTGQDISSIITSDVRRQPPGLRVGANE